MGAAALRPDRQRTGTAAPGPELQHLPGALVGEGCRGLSAWHRCPRTSQTPLSSLHVTHQEGLAEAWGRAGKARLGMCIYMLSYRTICSAVGTGRATGRGGIWNVQNLEWQNSVWRKFGTNSEIPWRKLEQNFPIVAQEQPCTANSHIQKKCIQGIVDPTTLNSRMQCFSNSATGRTC